MKRAWIKIAILFAILTFGLFSRYSTYTDGMETVYKNWDGPSYVLVARSLYVPEFAYENNFFHSVDIHPDWTWLPAHFPLYPLLIRAVVLSTAEGIGYFQASLVISLFFSLASLIAFYELARSLKFVQNPLLLTIPMLVLTPRWFIASHVAGSESMFALFLILTMYYLNKKKMLSSAIFASLAQLTRPQGVLIGLALGIVALFELVKTRDLITVVKKYYYFLLTPLALLLVFTFYFLQTGNFFAFFEAIAIFGHFNPTLFSTFSFKSPNIETFWQEINAVDYVLYFVACLTMFRKKLSSFGILGLVLFLPLVFLQHSDISRYALPMLPILFLAFSEVIERKEFAIGSLLMSPAIIAYALDFMKYNRAP